MNLPGFTAEASLYKTSKLYKADDIFRFSTDIKKVVTQSFESIPFSYNQWGKLLEENTVAAPVLPLPPPSPLSESDPPAVSCGSCTSIDLKNFSVIYVTPIPIPYLSQYMAAVTPIPIPYPQLDGLPHPDPIPWF
jgi:hypothetical protein